MIVEPFRRTPKPPRIALVNDEGIYLSEDGSTFLPSSGYKFRQGEIVCYILWDTAVSLTRRGRGEILRWNAKEIRWRDTPHLDETEWIPRPLDAGIIQFPISLDTDFEDVLSQLVEFRDWLVSEGASPHCSLGSTSISLLRAKLSRRLITSLGACPPLGFTRGGRTVMGKNGKGKYEGQIFNWDLPAAYASTLGNITYNGTWQVRPLNAAVKAHEHGSPVYCQASVKIPGLSFGPLPASLRRANNPLEGALLNKFGYPRDGNIEGIWTLNELDAAKEVGCEISPQICWVMLTGNQPFLPWWRAIVAGRELDGALSRSLAKRTGNALWGMFCTDRDSKVKKVAVRFENGKAKIRRLDFRGNTQKPGHDLAEAVSSTVRAKLYQHIVAADASFLCAHTDGIWSRGSYDIPPGWRVKQEARRIDIIDPQTLRYYPTPNQSFVVMSGIPPKLAPEKFEERWARFERANSRKGDVQNVRTSSSGTRRVHRISSPDDIQG